MDALTTKVIEALGGEVEACEYDIPAIVSDLLAHNMEPNTVNIHDLAPMHLLDDPDYDPQD